MKTFRQTAMVMPTSDNSGGSGGTPINNQDKTITENGTYTADEGFTGLGTVIVDVLSQAGGGGDFKFGTVVFQKGFMDNCNVEHGLGKTPQYAFAVVIDSAYIQSDYTIKSCGSSHIPLTLITPTLKCTYHPSSTSSTWGYEYIKPIEKDRNDNGVFSKSGIYKITSTQIELTGFSEGETILWGCW